MSSTKVFFLVFLAFLIGNAPCQQYKEIFSKNTEKHIFKGDIKSQKGKLIASGCHHYSAIKLGYARIVPETIKNYKNGTFAAKVEIFDSNTKKWIAKTANGGYSTFFPKKWSVSKTISEIKKAYHAKEKVAGTNNEYKGICSENIEIRMYLKENGEIISAFPKQEE